MNATNPSTLLLPSKPAIPIREKSLYLPVEKNGLSRFLLSSKTYFWVISDFLLAFFMFRLFASFGREAHRPEIQSDNLKAALAFSVFFCLCGLAIGFFDKEFRFSRLQALRKSIFTWGLALALAVATLHFLFFLKVGRLALVFGSIGSLAGVYAFHFLMGLFVSRFPHRFVILGAGSEISPNLLRITASGDLRQHFTHLDHLRNQVEENTEVSTEKLIDSIEESGVTDIILTKEGRQSPRLIGLSIKAMQRGLRVIDEASFHGELTRRYPVESLPLDWVLSAQFDIHRPLTNLFKRTFDVAFSLVCCVLLLPLLLLISLAIKLTSRGPIFYIQTRQGRYSKPFNMIKFRTMTWNPTNEGAPATEQKDPRITYVGKLLRPLHFDELPQILNILKGDMSFVGPRPEAFEIVTKVNQFLPIFEIRHMLRPGLTGLAQISQGKTLDGKDEITQKLSYDLYYLKHYGVFFDLWIILRTAFSLTKKAW